MARILGGGTFGELRGKLGSLIFSRNASSAYVRAYVKPVNANTVAQSEARSVFSITSAMWHSLSEGEKQMWNTYATTKNFSSGMNAYFSLQNNVRNNARLEMAGSLGILDGDETVTEGSYQISQVPPIYTSLVPPFNIATISDFSTAQFNTSTSIITLSGLNFVFNDGYSAASPLLTGTGFNEDFTPAGISFYLSLPQAQEVQHFPNPHWLKIGVTPTIASVTAGSSASTGMSGISATREITGTKFATIANTLGSSFFSKITMYWEASQGEKLLLGSRTAQFERISS